MPYKRKFDFIDLWDDGYAFDAALYTQEEAIEIYNEQCPDPSETPTVTIKWARSECRNDIPEMQGHGHCYIIYEEQVKRSFKVWEVR